MLKWQFQPTHRGASWQKTIKVQRTQVNRRIQKTPSLKHTLEDTEWWDDAWGDATTQASKETGIDVLKFPEICPWTPEQILNEEFFPE